MEKRTATSANEVAEEDGDETILVNGMHAVSTMDGLDDGPRRQVPRGSVFGNAKADTEAVLDSIQEVDRLLAEDTSFCGKVNYYLRSGIYYVDLRCKSLLVYCNLVMLALLVFIGMYERSNDIVHGLVASLLVSCSFGLLVWLFDYVRTISSEVQQGFNHRILVRYITFTNLSAWDMCTFWIHLVLFACLFISCVVIVVRCDTPGSECNDLYAFLMNVNEGNHTSAVP